LEQLDLVSEPAKNCVTASAIADQAKHWELVEEMEVRKAISATIITRRANSIMETV